MTECDSVAYDQVMSETWQVSDMTKGNFPSRGSMIKTPTFVASAAREG